MMIRESRVPKEIVLVGNRVASDVGAAVEPQTRQGQQVWKPLAETRQSQQVQKPLAETSQGQQVRKLLAGMRKSSQPALDAVAVVQRLNW